MALVPQVTRKCRTLFGLRSGSNHLTVYQVSSRRCPHFEGQGAPQDYTEALQWFRSAADQGNADAQYNLGVMYDEGQGVPQDDTEALQWYRRAADQGNADARFNLGVMYFEGQRVPQDYTLAYMWLNLAAAAGAQDAPNALDVLTAGLMTPEQIAKAQRLTREWRPK